MNWVLTPFEKAMDTKPSGIFYTFTAAGGGEHIALPMSSDAKTERGTNVYGEGGWANTNRRLCSCCGAFPAAPDDDISFPSNGILVARNNPTPEKDDDKYLVKRLQTKNGTLTIAVLKNV